MTTLTENRLYTVWLNAAEGIGARRFYDLVARFGSAKEVYDHATYTELLAVPLMGEKISRNLLNHRSPEMLASIQERLEKSGVAVLLSEEEPYPELLREIAYPPPVLYVKGSVDFKRMKALAIVGTRKASRYGQETAYRLASQLGERGITVVAGLARGVDSYAHAGALAGGGETIAVLGSGLDIIYPRENEKLHHRIMEHGAIISDYFLGVPPLSYHFPARNRIISGLSRGTIVVESRIKGGSLITASYALEQNRDLFAVPGNIDVENAAGPNALIAEGAKPVLGVSSFLEEYPDWFQEDIQNKPKKQPSKREEPLNQRENLVYHHLKMGEMPFDALVIETGMASGELAACLTMMEIKGMISQLPGRTYRL